MGYYVAVVRDVLELLFKSQLVLRELPGLVGGQHRLDVALDDIVDVVVDPSLLLLLGHYRYDINRFRHWVPL